MYLRYGGREHIGQDPLSLCSWPAEKHSSAWGSQACSWGSFCASGGTGSLKANPWDKGKVGLRAPTLWECSWYTSMGAEGVGTEVQGRKGSQNQDAVCMADEVPSSRDKPSRNVVMKDKLRYSRHVLCKNLLASELLQ